MGRRRRAREAALQVLYQLEITEQDAEKALVQWQEHFATGDEEKELEERLIRGVVEHVKEIDRLIEVSSEHWHLERMALIDRSILRMAAFELLYCDDIPPKATLNEAVDLGKRFGSEESGSFVNGILDRILHEVAHRRNP